MTLPEALSPLAAWPQFILYKLVPSTTKPGKLDKVPMSAVHGYGASTTNPAHWTTYDRAVAYLAAHPGAYDGIGFVFTLNDPFFFLDIDGAYVNGAWSQLATALCGQLAGAAIEVSQSHTGLHIFGTCTKPLEHANKDQPNGLELYTTERFVALTGISATGNAALNCDASLAPIIAAHFDPARKVAARDDTWTTEPCAEWSGPADDDELLAKILASQARTAAAAFGGANLFQALWDADADVLGARWPDRVSGRPFAPTEAEQSLANTLAWWTGKDCERIERMMRRSALARDKWDHHGTYLQNTIIKACMITIGCYTDKSAPPPPPEEIARAGFTIREGSGNGIMFASDQLEHFKDCIYISSINRVLTPRGDKLDQSRFDVHYGGHDFVIALDGKKTTSSAWIAFTENQAFTAARADKLCFRPELGAGGIVNDGTRTLANFYTPAQTAIAEGDPTPFLNHMSKMLPNGNDLEVLLHYMASVKQNPGMKAQWWPVLQGGQGNGKTYILMVMAYAVGGQYSHLPNMDKMIRNGMNFNGWIEGKLFLGLEEIYAANRREFFEGFKTTVTNPNLPIEGKGVEEATGDNRANGIITTNHKDGVPIDDEARRYCVFFTAQQKKEHLARDGMTATYFADFRDWMYGRGVYAIHGVDYGFRVVNNYLANYRLKAELDPAQLALWAPETSATRGAVDASRGRAEQEILEAVEQGRPGFSGGWISSIKLDDLLERLRLNIPRSKRRELLQTLDYDWHPHLLATQGRLNTIVAPDNGKPKLFIRNGHPNAAYESKDAIAKAYSEAQLSAGGELTAAGKAFG